MTTATEVYVPPLKFDIELAQGSATGAVKEAEAQRQEAWMVPLDNIKIVAGLNVRVQNDDYEAHIEDIKNSIVKNGFYRHMPIAGFAGKEGDLNFIYCTGGFTRLEAAKRARAEGAPIEKIPVILRPPGTSMVDLIYGLHDDNSGEPLTPYEKAIVVKRLQAFNIEKNEICERMRITPVYFDQLLYLMSLSRPLQGLVISGKVAARNLVDLAKKVGQTEALHVLERSLPDNDKQDAGRESASRATPARIAKASGVKPIPKKTVFKAIDYALSLPGTGLDFLKRWRDREDDAIAELEAYAPPRKNASKKPAKPKGDGTGTRRGRPPKDKPAEAPSETATNLPEL